MDHIEEMKIELDNLENSTESSNEEYKTNEINDRGHREQFNYLTSNYYNPLL